jgi:8-oxo-dGTP pyrophosphatase MutT (NUDIX family)
VLQICFEIATIFEHERGRVKLSAPSSLSIGQNEFCPGFVLGRNSHRRGNIQRSNMIRPRRYGPSKMKQNILVALFLLITFAVLAYIYNQNASSSRAGLAIRSGNAFRAPIGTGVAKNEVDVNKTPKNECEISMPSGTYRGPKYTLPGTTIGTPQCILDSKFVQVSRHTLQFSEADNIIDDWVWIDYHDRINILVESPNSRLSAHDDDNEHERTWLIFQQTKYALEGRQSLAIIGGIIEPDDESAVVAAHREAREEMHVECRTMIPLGRYRTDVNRGMGWVNSFVAMDCTSVSVNGGDDVQEEQVKVKVKPSQKEQEVGAADQEQQDLTTMTTSQVLQGVRDGRFLEVQWSNTVALAMLHPAVTSKSKTQLSSRQ